jgi:hypothetical protein
MENMDPQRVLMVTTPTAAMLEPEIIQVEDDKLKSLCPPCKESLASPRDLASSLAVWKGVAYFITT